MLNTTDGTLEPISLGMSFNKKMIGLINKMKDFEDRLDTYATSNRMYFMLNLKHKPSIIQEDIIRTRIYNGFARVKIELRINGEYYKTLGGMTLTEILKKGRI